MMSSRIGQLAALGLMLAMDQTVVRDAMPLRERNDRWSPHDPKVAADIAAERLRRKREAFEKRQGKR